MRVQRESHPKQYVEGMEKENLLSYDFLFDSFFTLP